MITIRPLNKASLTKYLTSEEFLNGQFLPITTQRAQSHIRNPRANDDDILLLLAYSEGTPVGYLGILADWIFEPDGTQHKCGWLSCMWIDPTHRGKGISKKLVHSALDHWNQKILVTEFTAAAKGLYDKVGAFKDLQTLKGIRIYRRLDLAKFLPPKKKLFNDYKWLLSFIDQISNVLLDIRFLFRKSSFELKGLSYFDKLGPQEIKFIQEQNRDHLFHRGEHELNWILDQPWIASDQTALKESTRYHFSVYEKVFHFTGFTLRNEQNEICALLIFSIRGSNLKIPYCYFEDGMEDLVINCIQSMLNRYNIKTMTVFHKKLVNRLQKHKMGALYKKSIYRNFIISKTLTKFNNQESYMIQDGDGDCAFT